MPGEAEKLVSSSKSSRETDKGAQCDIQGGAVTVRPRALEGGGDEGPRKPAVGRSEADWRVVMTVAGC